MGLAWVLTTTLIASSIRSRAQRSAVGRFLNRKGVGLDVRHIGRRLPQALYKRDQKGGRRQATRPTSSPHLRGSGLFLRGKMAATNHFEAGQKLDIALVASNAALTDACSLL